MKRILLGGCHFICGFLTEMLDVVDEKR